MLRCAYTFIGFNIYYEFKLNKQQQKNIINWLKCRAVQTHKTCHKDTYYIIFVLLFIGLECDSCVHPAHILGCIHLNKNQNVFCVLLLNTLIIICNKRVHRAHIEWLPKKTRQKMERKLCAIRFDSKTLWRWTEHSKNKNEFNTLASSARLKYRLAKMHIHTSNKHTHTHQVRERKTNN